MEEVMQKYGIVIGSALFIIGASIFIYKNYQNKTKVQKKGGTKTKRTMSNKKQSDSNKSDNRETPDSSSKSSSNKYRGYKTDSEGKVR